MVTKLDAPRVGSAMMDYEENSAAAHEQMDYEEDVYNQNGEEMDMDDVPVTQEDSWAVIS
jgi:hypothetical protein